MCAFFKEGYINLLKLLIKSISIKAKRHSRCNISCILSYNKSQCF